MSLIISNKKCPIRLIDKIDKDLKITGYSEANGRKNLIKRYLSRVEV